MILRLIEIACGDGLPFVYLGYWIQNSHKMAYKSRFRPLEAFGHLSKEAIDHFRSRLRAPQKPP